MKTLKRGDTGDAVKAVQAALIQAGYTLAPTKSDQQGIDGIFGADTEAKIKQYQAGRGLPQTGTWGQAEQDAIQQPEPEPAPEEPDKVTLIIDRAIAELFAAALSESIREKTS